MYEYFTIPEQINGSELASKANVDRYGISVYVDSDPDVSGADFIICPADTEGIKIFREFAARMAAHYKSLNKEA